ncbi:MAG TPA: TatD family hydrolase [Terriglobia bacterium]|nr:TatD family hydrolase [Terriglobia bacterium]
MAQYVDSHAHLDAAEFDSDREAVIACAQEAGLRYIMLIADLAKPESVRTVRDLADRHHQIYWAAGIDPHESGKAREEHFETLNAIARHPKFLALGEIGLDYHYDYPRDAQKAVFRRQLGLARELGKPAVIHCRDAWSDLVEILRAQAAPVSEDAHSTEPPAGARSGILHCFSGTAEDACDLMALGFYVSFAGNVTFKKSDGLREAARSVPPERLLSETDSPYLASVPHRGRRNEPAFVREVTKELATLHGMTEDEMGRKLVENFAALFKLGSF